MKHSSIVARTNFVNVKWSVWLIVLSVAINNVVSLMKPHASRHHQHTSTIAVRQHGKDEFYSKNSSVDSDDGLSKNFEYVVNRKQDARITCNLTDGDNETSMTGNYLKWYHNGYEVDFNHRYAKDGSNGQLTINNVRLEDGGVWHCQDTNAGAIGNPVSLVVLDEPRTPYFLIDGRRLDPGNLFIPIKENNELSVQCIVEGGSPPPKINWILLPASTAGNAINSQEPNNYLTVPGLKVLNESRTSVSVRGEAKLSPVLRIHHNSTVLCVVSHVTLSIPLNASLLLDVQYTPSFGISRVPGFGYPITEGIPLSLKCDVDSNPAANPIWKKDNGSPAIEQSVDGFLNFTSVQLEDSGWYKCVTRYLSVEYASIGYFLNIREAANQAMQPLDFPEELTEEGSAVEVTLGGEIQLECPAGSISCWARSRNSGNKLEPLGPGPKLSLGNVVYQEAGEYKCFVGRSSKMEKWRSRSVQVNVIGMPVVYPDNKTITVVTEQRVTFSLDFCANPPARKVFWIRGTNSFPPGSLMDDLVAHNITESNTPHCRKAELTIPFVRTSHSGEYMLIVSSEKGMAGATIFLNITTSTTLTDDMRKDAAPSISKSSLSAYHHPTSYAILITACCTMITIYV